MYEMQQETDGPSAFDPHVAEARPRWFATTHFQSIALWTHQIRNVKQLSYRLWDDYFDLKNMTFPRIGYKMEISIVLSLHRASSISPFSSKWNSPWPFCFKVGLVLDTWLQSETPLNSLSLQSRAPLGPALQTETRPRLKRFASKCCCTC